MQSGWHKDDPRDYAAFLSQQRGSYYKTQTVSVHFLRGLQQQAILISAYDNFQRPFAKSARAPGAARAW